MKTKLLSSLVLLFAVLTAHSANLTVTKAIPTDGASKLALNTRIVLMFGENIAKGQASCTLNGQVIDGSISSKMITFTMPCLNYSTTYEFTAPEGAFVSTSDASKTSPEIKLSFSTLDRPEPTARVFDAIVAQDGSGDYTSIQQAVKAMPEKRTKPWLVFVKKGYYNEIVRVPDSKPYLHLIGEDSAQTVIAYKINCGFSATGGYTGPAEEAETFGNYADQYNYSYISGSEGESPVFMNKANNFYMENISLLNLWGTQDRDYPQALALRTIGDRVALYRCRLYSYQDTWQTATSSTSRNYAKDCFIEGNVDFIYDSGDVLLDSCHINIIKNRKPTEEAGWIAAPGNDGAAKWGYVFKDCYLSAERKGDSIYLGRPWHSSPICVYINLQLDDKIVLREQGFDPWYVIPTLFADWGTRDADGQLVDRSQRTVNYYDGAGNWKAVQNSITDQEAARYTFDNIIPGTDAWRPDIMMERLPAPEAWLNGQTLSWNPVKFAICYEVVREGEFVCFTTENSYTTSDQANYQVRAVNEFGALGQLSSVATGLQRTAANPARTVVSREYYNLLGQRLENAETSRQHIAVCRTLWSDGKTTAEKVSY